ncbi:calcium channel flower-like [Mya arenaria]|uniref:calcium channel flower-like n=1 Tax=Mya arenaria TaxID=6604 RepID=UPI0022E3AC78|nr:calcium channel flower-like [Mya arenaria]
MQASNQQNTAQDDQVSWWFKLLARGLGTIGGLVAMVMGIMRCLTFTPLCLVAGILELLAGFMVVVLEAPCCCPFLDFIDKIGKFSENRPYWQKGALYVGSGIVPILLCFSTTTVLGCALVFGTGVLYGMMALGKKASREEMLAKATGSDVEMNAGLIEHEQVGLHVPDSPAK